MTLAPPGSLFNVGCKVTWPFLGTTAWHSFYRLGAALNRWGEGEREFWLSLSNSNILLGLFHKENANLDNLCDLIATKLMNLGVECNAL